MPFFCKMSPDRVFVIGNLIMKETVLISRIFFFFQGLIWSWHSGTLGLFGVIQNLTEAKDNLKCGISSQIDWTKMPLPKVAWIWFTKNCFFKWRWARRLDRAFLPAFVHTAQASTLISSQFDLVSELNNFFLTIIQHFIFPVSPILSFKSSVLFSASFSFLLSFSTSSKFSLGSHFFSLLTYSNCLWQSGSALLGRYLT